MTKPLPPRDKRLALRELVNLPEGTEVEYWCPTGSFGGYNPLTIGSDGYARDKDWSRTSWKPPYTYALAPKKVKRLKALHVVLAEADDYFIDEGGDFMVRNGSKRSYIDIVNCVHLFNVAPFSPNECWPDSWYEEIDE